MNRQLSSTTGSVNGSTSLLRQTSNPGINGNSNNNKTLSLNRQSSSPSNYSSTGPTFLRQSSNSLKLPNGGIEGSTGSLKRNRPLSTISNGSLKVNGKLELDRSISRTSSYGSEDEEPMCCFCPVCLERYVPNEKHPLLMDCGHSMCSGCFQQKIKTRKGPVGSFPCPECETTIHPKKDGEKTNEYVIQTLEYYEQRRVKHSITYNCILCHRIGKPDQEAVNICLICNERYCEDCTKPHQFSRATQDHEILPLSEYLSGDPRQIYSKFPVYCAVHPDQKQEYFCQNDDCKICICMKCRNSKHHMHHCIEIKEKAGQGRDMLEQLAVATRKRVEHIQETKDMVLDSKTLLMKEHSKAVNVIDEHAEEIIKNVQWQAEVCKEHLKSQVDSNLQGLEDLCETLNTKQTLANNLFEKAVHEFNDNNLVSIVGNMELRKRQLHDWKNRPALVNSVSKIAIKFSPGNLREMINKNFGAVEVTSQAQVTIESEHQVIKPQLVKQVELDHACWGIAKTPAGDLAIAVNDVGVQIFDEELELKSKFQVKKPNDITCLDSGELVVTCSTKANDIKLFKQDGTFVKDICYGVNKPQGLTHHKKVGLIALGRYPEAIYLCTQEGGIKKTVRNGKLSCVNHVAFNPAKNHIVVSDVNNHAVYVMDQEGTIIAQYGGTQGDEENELDGPKGVCVTEDHIIVADNHNHRVVLLSHNGQFVKTLLNKQDGILFPANVAIDRNGDLVVGESHSLSNRKNHLHIFKYIV
ncbi:unnamed protein product [Owenia fusiformis]|uniref:Uncharacterized protein n=1 Tax=Owenia fusiformis TaxID=6347 RepID=A0A8J1YBH3_OWEFU|nr:unnamed protein product [Owenia fusiformis]